VNTHTGELIAERVRINASKPPTPVAIIAAVVEVVNQSSCSTSVGCGFPAVVKDSLVPMEANIDQAATNFDIRDGWSRNSATR